MERSIDVNAQNPHWQAQHFVNLEVQISSQAQRLANLGVQISRQANLEVQISWQVQHFVNLEVTVHSCLSTSSTRISTAQARRIWVAAVGASSDCALVVAPCAFWYTVVTLRGRRKGNVVFWRSKVDFSCQMRGIGAVLLRNAVSVAGAALWTWW